MKATLDHIGIAVGDLSAALAFYRDALGLEIEAPEEVSSQHVRAHFVDVGRGAKLELLEATSPDSAIAKYVAKRGPGIHHITLRVDDIAATLAQLKAKGARMIDEQARPGAEGSLIAFVHPATAHGVLVELKQAGARAGFQHSQNLQSRVTRHAIGDLELLSLSDGFFRLDGGLMFGMIPKTFWSRTVPADERNRITLAMRPLVVRGVRTMIIDAGIGDKENAKFNDVYGVERARHLDHSLAEAGLKPEDIDIVLATHLHFDHAGGFTVRDGSGQLRPRFPRARYVVRRGEWDEAMHSNERTRVSYRLDNYQPLAEARVLDLVDDDQTIMPGVRVRRTGGHTMHHQAVWIESKGQHAVYPADLVPTTTHLPPTWILGIDSYPMDSLAAKQAFLHEAAEREALVFFDHDPAISAARISEQNGTWQIQR